jgi:hypothetical protein
MTKKENVIGCTRNKKTTENKGFVERRNLLAWWVAQQCWRIPAGIRTKFFNLLKRYTAYRHISGSNITADLIAVSTRRVLRKQQVAA